MKKLVTVLFVMFAALTSAGAAEKSKPAAASGAQAVPPEAKKTVAAFTGTWTFKGKLSGLADTPATATETMVCKSAAGGRAVSCSGKGSVQGMGAIEDAALVTWDAEAKNVRFVGMDSMGEVHDHTCTWKDDKNLACEPLTVTTEGQQATVDLQIRWADAKNMTFSETTTMKDGKKVAFEGTAKRK